MLLISGTSVPEPLLVRSFPDGRALYRIASRPWSNRFYASADAFYNEGWAGEGLHGTPYYDSKVPVC